MNSKVEKLQKLRGWLLNKIEKLNTEQLNYVPEKYSNNIIWNIGHLIEVQQRLCYIKSGLPTVVDMHYLAGFLPGTQPGLLVPEERILILKEWLMTTMDQLAQDIEEGRFVNYTPIEPILKVYGFPVTDINQALEYLLYHEGLHTGHVLSLLRHI